jgi:hypothetical protein
MQIFTCMKLRYASISVYRPDERKETGVSGTSVLEYCTLYDLAKGRPADLMHIVEGFMGRTTKTMKSVRKLKVSHRADVNC